MALTARAAATVDATPAVDEATDDAAGKAVHNSLRACTTATAVLDVAQREPLSARNTITALRALAKLSAKAPAPEQAALRSHDGFTMLLSTAEGHLPAMNAFQLSNCMQDVALLGAPVSAEFRATADAQVEALVSEFNVSGGAFFPLVFPGPLLACQHSAGDQMMLNLACARQLLWLQRSSCACHASPAALAKLLEPMERPPPMSSLLLPRASKLAPFV